MRITAQVWKPLLPLLNEKLAASCLQRDAYLDRVFAHEASMLDKEVPEPNSEEVQQMLRKHLRDIRDRVPQNFTFSEITVQLLNDVCDRKRVPRDCFINRVLLFLVARQPDLVDRVYGWKVSDYLPEVLDNSGYTQPVVPWHLGGPLAVIDDIVSGDPFWVFRECIDIANEISQDGIREPSLHAAYIYKDFFQRKDGGLQNALGFNCCLPPPVVPPVVLDDSDVLDLWNLDAFLAETPPVPDRKTFAKQEKS